MNDESQSEKRFELYKKRQALSKLFEFIVEKNGDVVFHLLRRLPVARFNGKLKRETYEVLKIIAELEQ